MANDKDNIEPVEGITASRNEDVSLAEVEMGSADGLMAESVSPEGVDMRSLDDLAAEMVVEDLSEAPESTVKTTAKAEAVHPDFEGMDPAVLSANQDIQKFQLMEYLEMMMTLREAQRQHLPLMLVGAVILVWRIGSGPADDTGGIVNAGVGEIHAPSFAPPAHAQAEDMPVIARDQRCVAVLRLGIF